MKKLYLLLGLVFLLLFSFVSAVDLTSPAGYWSWDDGFGDDTGNIINATVLGTDVTRTSTDCKLNDCVDSSVAGASNQLDLNFVPSSGSYSLSTWCKWDAFTVSAQDQCLSTWTGVDGGFYFGYDGSDMVMNVRQDSSWVIQYSDTGISTGQWYFITLTFDASGKEIKYYRDGSLLATSSAISTFSYPNANTTLMGQPGSTTRSMNGRVDEMSYYTDVLSLTEHQELYNSGAGYNPTTSNITVNDSTESTAVVKQVGSVTFGGGGMTTILSSDFNVSVNNTPLYGAYNFNIQSNGNNNVYCELLIDGIVYANDTRSNIAGFKGVFNLQTPYFELDNSTSHTQTLQCQRTSGVGLTTVANAVGIGHFAVDQENNFLAHNDTVFVSSVSSGVNYTLLDSFQITISNKTSDDNNHSLVVEGSLHYNNTLGVTQELNTYMQINDTRCAFYPRDVQGGNVGSVSVDCAVENVTAEATYLIEIYGNGTATYDGTIIAKDLFLSDEEIAGGTGVLNGTTFSGANDTLLFNLTGGNLNHDVANVFQKVSYSIETDVNTEVNFYVIIKNGSTFQTINFSRDFQAGVVGVLSGHDVLQNIPIDPNYVIELWANCGNALATCEIKGGSSLGYLTDVVTTVINAFNVSAFDIWDNSSILNFSVVDGGTWTTTTGSVLVFTENNPENLTVTSSNYFSDSVLGHNTSLDLNVSLKNSDIKFRSYEIGSNNTITTTNFTIDGVTKAYDDSFYLKAGSYNVTVSGGGYYSRTQEITVTALDNTTLRFDGDNGLGNTIFNITLTDYVTSLAIPNFSVVVVSNESYDYTFTENTTNSYIQVIGIQNDSYVLNITSSGYASRNNELLFNTNNYTAYDYLMFTYNSILLNIFDATTFSLIQPQQINISFIYADTNFQNSTTTGLLYIDLLMPETYELRFFTSGYSIVSKYLTVTNDSTQNVSIFLDVNTTSVSQRFRVVDTSGGVVENAVLRVQKEVLGYTENWLTVQETTTDSNGYCYAYIEKDPNIYYRFAVIVDGEVKPLSPSGSLFTTKTNFVTSFEETIQLVVNLEEETESAIDILDSISYELSFTGANNENINFTFADGLSTIVGGRLLIYFEDLNGSIGKTLVYNTSVLDFDGEISTSLPVINNTKYTVEAYILFQNSNSLVDSRIIVYEGDKTIPASVGLMLGIIVMLFVMFITIVLRPLLSIILTIGVLYPLTVFGIISIPASIITSLIALGIILFVKVRGGDQQ